MASLVGGSTGSIDFLGFVSTEAFDNFTFLPGKDIGTTKNTSEEFYLDALIFAQPISEPNSLLLFVAGFWTLALQKRKLKA